MYHLHCTRVVIPYSSVEQNSITWCSTDTHDRGGGGGTAHVQSMRDRAQSWSVTVASALVLFNTLCRLTMYVASWTDQLRGLEFQPWVGVVVAGQPVEMPLHWWRTQLPGQQTECRGTVAVAGVSMMSQGTKSPGSHWV